MKSSFKNIKTGFFSSQMVKLHDWIGNECVYETPVLSDSLKKYIDLIPEIKPPVFEKLDYTINRPESKKAAVAFSGGKDSIAAAIKLKEAGYDVTLFFLAGVNRSFHLEKEVCYDLSNKCGMPLLVAEGSFSGKHYYNESPIKNQLILSLMIDSLVDTCVFSSGNDTSDKLIDMKIKFNWSDSIEMYDKFSEFIKHHFLEYQFLIMHQDENDAINYLANNHPAILNDSISCILPHRFNKSIREKNEKTFGVKLMKNRCGSCEKCCHEYIHLSNVGFLSKKQSFYDHCVNFLKNKKSTINVPDHK
jgi:7-cyano-7-deazaguanine synthase in queuosine biosynthesis